MKRSLPGCRHLAFPVQFPLTLTCCGYVLIVFQFSALLNSAFFHVPFQLCLIFRHVTCRKAPGTRQSMARQVQAAPRVLWLLLFLADVCVTSCLMGACQMANILLASRSFSCSCDEQINFVCSPISRRAPNQFNPAYNPLAPIARHRLLSTSSRLGCAGPGHVSATRSSFAFAFVLAANLSQRWQPTKLSLFGYHF